MTTYSSAPDSSPSTWSTGRFVIGQPRGDRGLTGRKIIVDTDGGMARHGGAFSGKDATTVDRSAAYAARYVAKNVVAADLAERFELQVAYAIGAAWPLSVGIECFGTNQVAEEVILKLIDEHFDLRPGAIIRDLKLRRPIYRATAAYGHFGRDDLDLPWERMDKAHCSARRQDFNNDRTVWSENAVLAPHLGASDRRAHPRQP